MSFYAVKRGLRPGIYESWGEAQPLVSGFPGAAHKSFATREAAEAYMATEPPRVRLFKGTGDRVALRNGAYVIPASRETAEMIVALAQVGCPVTEPALRHAKELASKDRRHKASQVTPETLRTSQ